MAPSYFAFIDIWRDIPVVKDYETVHFYVFICLCLLILFSHLNKELRTSISERDTRFLQDYLQSALFSLERIARGKIKHLHDRLKTVNKDSKIFSHIVDPSIHMNAILEEFVSAMERLFNVDRDDIDMNIMVCYHENSDWDWSFTYGTKPQRTDPNTLMNGNSTAREAVNSGRAVLYTDKSRLPAGAAYYVSPRDQPKSSGFIYCDPIFVYFCDGVDKYLFSVNTYGSRLCDPQDSARIKFFSSAYLQYRHRMELELINCSVQREVAKHGYKEVDHG